MADLEHFFRNYPERQKHTWYLSGESRRGVEMMVDMLRDAIQPLGSEFYSFHLRDDSVGDIVDALYLESSYPRLIVVRDVELITDLEVWIKFLRVAVAPETTYVIYVDNSVNPRKGAFPEVFRWIAKIGRFVEARPLPEPKLILIIKHLTGLSDLKALRLLRQVGSDLDTLLAELWKFRAADLHVGDFVVFDVPSKPDPINALFDSPMTMPLLIDMRQLMGLVELELVREAAVVDGIRDKLKYYEMANKFNIPQFVIESVVERARKLTPIRLASRLALVNRTQSLLRLNADPEVLRYWFFLQWRLL